MSLKRIKDSILNDAKNEAEELIKVTENDFQKKIENEKINIEEFFKKKFIKTKKELEEEINRKLTEQRINYKMEILDLKNRVIENVFNSAVNKFISDEKYFKTMEMWLKDIKEPCVIFMNARDSKWFKNIFVKKLSGNDEIKLNNENIDIKGGFILKTDRFEIDHSLEHVLSNLKLELSPLIVSKLFPE